MRSSGSAAVLAAVVLTAGVAFSGGTQVDPPAPHGFPGAVPAFLTGLPGSGPDRGNGESAATPPTRGYARRRAIRRERRWLARSVPLGDGAPPWARRMYRRSLLVLRALTDERNGAAVAGARPGWAYIWPRDAGAVAIALASAGYRNEARRVARFLLDLELGAAARFDQTGEPIEGRGAQGDALGWVAAAAKASGLPVGSADRRRQVAFDSDQTAWLGPADYQEKDGGDYLGNAIASTFAAAPPGRGASSRRARQLRPFETDHGLVRAAGDPDSGLDTAAAWAVRPFPHPALFPAVRRTLLQLVAERDSRFGLIPSENWDGGDDPWTAPTAWTAWALAALAKEERREAHEPLARRDRRAALALMGDLRRAATPLGILPERVDSRTGLPTSTTPLSWSHAFTILAIRELWPARR